MELGMVGLGRMGGNMAARLRADGHRVVGFARHAHQRDVTSLAAMVDALTPPRVVWVMVPAGAATQGVLDELGQLLSPGDVVVDGGNSRWTEAPPRAQALAERGIGFVDCGVSGGVWGRDNGYALMCGGEPEHVARLTPIIESLKPAGDYGYVHAGPVGAGHFTKMVHNGIEYGVMQAYAEGYELLTASEIVPDVEGVLRSWRSGTVIRSWLLDLLDEALAADPGLRSLAGYAEDSGEGRWTVQAAIDHAVPLPVISAALFARFASRQEDSPAMKAVAAMRSQFGGHAVRAATEAASSGLPPGPSLSRDE